MPIRIRLTLWYLLILTIVLASVAAGVYAFVSNEERSSVDRVLRERADAFARAYAGEAHEQPGDEAMVEVTRDYGRGNADIFVYTGSQKLLARSPMRLLRVADARTIPEIRTAIQRAVEGRATNVTIDHVRCIVTPIESRGKSRYVFISTESLSAKRNALRVIRNAFTIVIPVALAIAALGGYFLAMRSLAPVAQMTEAASRIEAENLSERIEVRNTTDELGRLASVLNALLERLERSFQQQKQLLADTSHELRTPVTIIRSEAEVTLSRSRDVDEYRKALEVIRSESSHLTSLIEGVLLLARADAQQTAIAKEPVPLTNVIDDSVQALRRVAEARQIDLACATDGPMPIRGDAGLLRRMLLNLLDNAIKFTDAGGQVRLDARRDSSNYVITISDTGSGIPPEAQEKVFDRFFRADAVRGRDDNRDSAGGAGLGLPIARWIARAHGGDLRLVHSSSAGSTFEAVLPK
jgi:two-component system OmpR family sensor kinase